MLHANICNYNNCTAIFPTLLDLIEHVESIHICFDESILQDLENEQLKSVPFSVVLPFTTAERREQLHFQQLIEYDPEDDKNEKPRARMTEQMDVGMRDANARSSAEIKSARPNSAREQPSDCLSQSDSDNSDFAWRPVTTSFIAKNFYQRLAEDGKKKTYACPVPGCLKLYKNVNGIKYHAKHGHVDKKRIYKRFHCFCGKSYFFEKDLNAHKLNFCHHDIVKDMERNNIVDALNISENEKVSGFDGSSWKSKDIDGDCNDWFLRTDLDDDFSYPAGVVGGVLFEDYPFLDPKYIV